MRHPFFVLFLAVLALATIIFSLGWPASRALLLGFDVAAALFTLASFLAMRGAPAERLRATAARNDAGRGLTLLLAGIALLVILLVLGIELSRPAPADGGEVALVAVTLTLAWLFGNMAYALHYAHIYYDSAEGGGDHAGLDFPGSETPDFLDFCYFAFVLGMTFQVSDVQIVSRRLRRVAVVHGLVAFAFNIGVVALTVNVVGSAL